MIEESITSCRQQQARRRVQRQQVLRQRVQQQVRRVQQKRQQQVRVQRRVPGQQQERLLLFCHKRPEQRPTGLPTGGIFS